MTQSGGSDPGIGRGDGLAGVFADGHDRAGPRQVAVVGNHDMTVQGGFQLLDLFRPQLASR